MSPGLAPSDRHDRFASWLVIPLVAVLAVVLVVFYGLFSTATVDGGSMLPTLKSGDKLLVTKSYAQPIRDDIVIVHLADEAGKPHDIVKRIIGVPGDTVEVQGDVARVNGSVERGHDAIIRPRTSEVVPPVKVPPGQVYVMGDNRPVSLDSRYIGTVPIEDIQGRVEAVFAPINRIQRIN